MLVPAIHFQNVCDEALTYYKEALGAKVLEVAYFKDAPEDSGMEKMGLPPNFVMHSEVEIFGTKICMTDGAEKPVTSENFSLMVALNSAEDVTSVFNTLADGGKVAEPLAPQFWSTMCGTVEDRFGVSWHVYMDA